MPHGEKKKRKIEPEVTIERTNKLMKTYLDHFRSRSQAFLNMSVGSCGREGKKKAAHYLTFPSLPALLAPGRRRLISLRDN
jgi:hypothetical protein